MVYDFTNPIYILLMILLFGVPIVTPVIYGQYRSTTTGFDLEGQLMLGLLFILFWVLTARFCCSVFFRLLRRRCWSRCPW